MLKEINLSIQQKSLWLHNVLNPSSDSLNIGLAFRMKGKIDQQLFIYALKDVFEKNVALKTIFREDDKSNVFQNFNGNFHEPITLWISEENIYGYLVNEYSKPFNLKNSNINVRTYFLNINETECVFLIVSHHIIFDFFSARLLVKELLQQYKKYLSGHSDFLVYPDYSFASFVEKQQGVISKHSVSRNFWSEYLHNCPTFLKISGDHKVMFSPNSFDHVGNMKVKYLDLGLARSIFKFASENKTSLYNVLFSFFNILLYRYSSLKKFIIGTPFLGREREFLGSIGYFANILPLKCEIDDTLSVLEYIKRNENEINIVKRHQLFPFEEIQKLILENNHKNFDSTFHVVFSYLDQGKLEKVGRDHLDESGFICENINLPSQADLFDLTLEVKVIDEKIQLNFKYKNSEYSDSFIEALSQLYIDIIDQGINHPDIPIGSQKVFKQTIFINKNDYEQNDCIGIAKTFHEQSAIHADKTALIFKDYSFTYKELSDHVKKFSFLLNARFKTKVGDRVGLCIDRSHLQIISILSVLNIGNAYVPLSPDYPDDRLSFLIVNSCVDYLLVDRKNYSRIQTLCGSLPIIVVEELFESSQKVNYEDFVCVDCSSIDTAYVFYTSGTSGVPKGIEVTQGSVLNLINNNYITKIDSKNIFMNLSNYAFDGSVYDIFGSLLKGGTLILLSSNIPTPEEIAQICCKYQPNIVFITTGLFHALVQSSIEIFDNLETVITGGEPMQPKYVEKLLPNKNVKIINAYGPTECTVFSTFYRVQELKFGQQAVPIGKALSGLIVEIIDEKHYVLPPYIQGEIVISGKGLAKGYVKSENIKNNGFVTVNETRFYKTGDIGFKGEDGNIVFVGRKDRQIKYRGHRIELAEIETVLLNHKDIIQTIVILEDIAGSPTLIALVEVDENKLTEGDLKNYLAIKLPLYMVPNHIIFEKLALNNNGKLDIQYAKSLIRNHDFGEQIKDLPKTDIEQKIFDIWKKSLTNISIGIYDNFFACGGDSITAIRVSAEITNEFKTNISIVNIYEHPTIHSLSRLVENNKLNSTKNNSILIKKIDRSKHTVNN